MPSGNVNVSTADAYLGRLFQSNRRPNALLRLMGGLAQGIPLAKAREFPVGVWYNLRSPAQPAHLEGADAPTAQHRTFTQATNVVQIFHETVGLSWLGLSDNSFAGLQVLPGGVEGDIQNPRSMSTQVGLAIDTVAQDANYSFLRGTYANPADPASTALKTRGLLTAITTNIVPATGVGTFADYRNLANDLHKALIDNGAMLLDDAHFLFCDSTQFANMGAAWETKTTVPESRTVAGVQVRTILTRFGRLNLVLEMDMPAGEIAAANMSVVGPVGLPVPNKGVLFEQALPETGSTSKTQIYGQLGIDHGPEWCHAKASGLPTDTLRE